MNAFYFIGCLKLSSIEWTFLIHVWLLVFSPCLFSLFFSLSLFSFSALNAILGCWGVWKEDWMRVNANRMHENDVYFDIQTTIVTNLSSEFEIAVCTLQLNKTVHLINMLRIPSNSWILRNEFKYLLWKPLDKDIRQSLDGNISFTMDIFCLYHMVIKANVIRDTEYSFEWWHFFLMMMEM